ncbi:MAG: uracil-DNA glycosylase, partial [Dehalococcoidia bacterium]
KPEQLQDLNARVAACTACRLAQGRTQTVPGDGDPNAELMFIGEAPGFNEDRQGHPFVGQAGRLLDQLLGEIGLTRADVFVTNEVKCRPPNNRDPEADEMTACEPFLTEQIQGIRPKLIVTLGRFAMQRFLPGAAISRVHGKPVNAAGRLIYPVYHPAAALRQGALMQVLREDFRRIPDLLAAAERPPPRPDASGGAGAGQDAAGQGDATQLPLL